MSPYTPTYGAGDLPAIGTDAVGTAGAAVVPLIPLAIGAGVLYWGAKYGKKKYKEIKKPGSGKGKGWWFNTPGHKIAAQRGHIKRKYR